MHPDFIHGEWGRKTGVGRYLNASYYTIILKFQDGVTCKEILTKQDHLNVVTATYNYITDANGVWNLGNCNS